MGQKWTSVMYLKKCNATRISHARTLVVIDIHAKEKHTLGKLIIFITSCNRNCPMAETGRVQIVFAAIYWNEINNNVQIHSIKPVNLVIKKWVNVRDNSNEVYQFV